LPHQEERDARGEQRQARRQKTAPPINHGQVNMLVTGRLSCSRIVHRSLNLERGTLPKSNHLNAEYGDYRNADGCRRDGASNDAFSYEAAHDVSRP